MVLHPFPNTGEVDEDVDAVPFERLTRADA